MNVSQHIIKNQKPQIVYILGGPGSGKGTQCEKLVRDFGFTHLSVGDLMRAEIASKSKEGERIEKLVANGEIVSTEITVGLLLKAISSNAYSKKFLIDGFPRGTDQALYLERLFREIDFIINYSCEEETLVARLVERGKTSGRLDDNEETIRKRVNVFNESTRPILEFYRKLGKVRTINADRPINEVYTDTLHNLLPNIITLYGAPVLGKSTVAVQLSQIIGYELINLQEFYQVNGLTKASDETKMDSLIGYLRDHYKRNFILDSFPETLRQAKIFIEHFAHPLYTFYFDATRDEVENNISEYVHDKKTRNARLNEYEAFIKERKAILSYLKDQPFFTRIAYSGKYIGEITKEIVQKLAPQIIALHEPTTNEQFLQSFGGKLETERGFTILDLPQLLSMELQRGTELGKTIAIQAATLNVEAGALPPLNQISWYVMEYLKKVLFVDPYRKHFLVRGFFEDQATIETFEQMVCKLSFIMSNPESQNTNIAPKAPLASYHALGKAIRIENGKEYLDTVDNYVNSAGKYGFIVGPQWSGKTTLAAYLKGKYANILVDWEKLTEDVKKKLTPPEGDAPEEAPVDEVTKELAERIRKLKTSDVCLLDGLPQANGQLFTLDQLKNFLEIAGPPKFLFVLVANDETMKNRYKLKNEVEEVPEEEQENLDAKSKEGQDIIRVFQQSIAGGQADVDVYNLYVNSSESEAKKDIDRIVYKRVILVRQNFSNNNQLDLENWVYSYGAQKNITVVHVYALIMNHLEAKDEFGKRLAVQLEMKEEISDVCNPSNYTPDLVLEIIQNYLQNNPKSSKYVIIMNYPNADNNSYWGPSNYYPRALDELYHIETKLGPIRAVISLVDQEEDYQIDDPIAEIIQVEEKKPEKVKAEGDDEENPEEDEDKKEEGEEEEEGSKPKFNPANYSWSNSNANSKNLTKVFHKRFNTVNSVQKLETDFTPVIESLDSLINKLEGGDQDNYYMEFTFGQ